MMKTPQMAYEFCKDNPELIAFIIACGVSGALSGAAGTYFLADLPL